jgi:Protein kinase domain
MRYVKGQDLNQALGSLDPLSAGVATRILDRVASALDAAHAVGLVHRDVTPANILLEGELGAKGVYLTDFGLVRGLDTSATQLSRTDQVIANLDYAAPEQIQGGRVDARTDVYALGCVLYRMLSGSRPFPGTDTQKMWKIVNDPLPSIGLQGDPIDAVIARATAKDPCRRFLSAGDLAGAAAGPDAATRVVERSVATGPAAAGYFEAAQGATEQATLPLHPTPPPGRGAGSGSKRRQGRLVALGLGAAPLLVGAAVAAFLIGGARGGSSRTVVRETVTAPAVVERSETSEPAAEDETAIEGGPSSSGQSARPSALLGLKSFGGIAYAVLVPRVGTRARRQASDQLLRKPLARSWRP